MKCFEKFGLFCNAHNDIDNAHFEAALTENEKTWGCLVFCMLLS